MAAHKTLERQNKKFDLRLFVAGSGARSLRTIESVKRAFEKHVPGQYHLSVVDIYVHPEAAVTYQVVAVPTLIRTRPEPVKMYVGEIRTPTDLDRRFGFWEFGLA